MVKEQVGIKVESETMKLAREKFINISQAAEAGIKKRLGQLDVTIDEEVNKCEYCKKEGEKATAGQVLNGELKHNSLTWLYPDERWICESCLSFIRVPIA